MESESRDHQHQSEVCTETPQSDYTFKEEHVPGLAEALVVVAYKWEQIAVALRLPKNAIEECRVKGSELSLKLYHVLYTWVVGQHSHAKPATKENLKTALASPLVQLYQLASEIEDKLKTSLNLNTPTISPKKSLFLNEVREVLVEMYSKRPQVPSSSWPPKVSKTFINLTLIETSIERLESNCSIHENADNIPCNNKAVEYEDIFTRYEKNKKVLVLGHPGSGKTTLVQKLIRDWSAGMALQGAELVFLVSLRRLKPGCDKKLVDILQQLFLKENLRNRVSNAVEHAHGERVCFILDGFDEYICPNESIILALLDRSYLVYAMVILTSRPAAASACAEVIDSSFIRIEVFGFRNSQIKEYIHHFPFSPNSIGGCSEKVQDFVSSNPRVFHLCYLPLNCAIICHIYDTQPEKLNGKDIRTQAQIYDLFTTSIIHRHLNSTDKFRQLSSLEDLKGQEAKYFMELCRQAFDMTTKNKQVITLDDEASSDEAQYLGLVTTDITAELSGYKNSYSFLHLTLQEFLAAYHLIKHDQQLSLFKKHNLSHHSLLNIWKLYFGLAKSSETKEDVAKEVFRKHVSVQLVFDNKKSSTIETPRSIMSLFKIQCSYEALQSNICWLASSRKLVFINSTLSNYDMSAIAYTMSTAATKESLATPTQESLATLTQESLATPTQESLATLTQESLATPTQESLATPTQKSLATPTKTLIFQSWGPGNDKLKTLLSQLTSNALGYLEHLDISYVHLAIADIKELAKKLPKLKSLTFLYLERSGIGDEGAAVLAEGLNGNHVLECLNMSGNLITAKGVGKIMKVVCAKHLILKNIGMNDEGARIVARGLRGNFRICSIFLSHNVIGIDGIEALALALHENALNFNFLKTVPSSKNTSESSSCKLEKIEGSSKKKSCLDLQQPTIRLNCSMALECQNSSYDTTTFLDHNSINQTKVESLLQRINASRSISWGCFQNNDIWMQRIGNFITRQYGQ